MLEWQHRHQGLIHGAHAHIRQQSLLARIGEPLITGSGCRLLAVAISMIPRLLGHHRVSEVSVQVTRPMGEYQIGHLLFVEPATVDISHAPIHGVGGGHGGQTEIHTPRLAVLQKTMHQCHGGFGLTGAGNVFQNKQLGAGPPGQILRPLLQRRRLKTKETSYSRKGRRGKRRAKTQCCQRQLSPGQRPALPVITQRLRRGLIGEDGLIRPQPVRQHRETRQMPGQPSELLEPIPILYKLLGPLRTKPARDFACIFPRGLMVFGKPRRRCPIVSGVHRLAVVPECHAQQDT